jgi:PAS domain S-box-containing protein
MSSLSEIISQNVVDSLPVGLLIVDETGNFVTVNPAAAAILGFSQTELLGRGLGELFFTDAANHLFGQVLVEVIQRELVGVCREVPYLAPGGESRQISITSSYLRGEAAQAGVVIILHDITQLYRMQRRENEILTEINQVQEDKIRCLSKLAASVAHQIRNPAAAIGGFATRLDRQIRDQGLSSRYPEIIIEEARRLETIVKTVGRFAALSRLRLAPASLADIVATARREAEARTSPLGRTVTWRIEAPDVELVADQDLLAAAFTELFDNAIRHARKDTTTIQVTGTLSSHRVQLLVADDGPGVAPADRPHVFDPFYSSLPDGSGMGLPLALEILINHNGSLRLENGHGAGARFRLSIPLFPRHLVSRLEGPLPV